jgi:hypothetical protein
MTFIGAGPRSSDSFVSSEMEEEERHTLTVHDEVEHKKKFVVACFL